jgi:alkanesulfonate monooxygenase SsuD/methylene tetrahydromethanopterin reductase-like flavin-dependent oxidoreductase (luciferase family)
VPKKRIPIYVGGTSKPALRRAARYGDGWLGIIHPMEEIEGLVAELNDLRREFGRDKEPFDIILQCPDAQSVEDIRRLEDLGVTDLKLTPWTEPSIQAELGVSAMREQPPLGVKLEAIKRYGEEMIAKFR